MAHEMFFKGNFSPSMRKKFLGFITGITGLTLIEEEKNWATYLLDKAEDTIVYGTSAAGWRDDPDDANQLKFFRDMERAKRDRIRRNRALGIPDPSSDSDTRKYQEWRNKIRRNRPLSVTPQYR